MSWKCPDCSNDNEDMRCECGYERFEGCPTSDQITASTNSPRTHKPIKVTLSLLKVYIGISVSVFVAGYYLFKIREMGLYVFMTFLNFPASLVTIGVSEDIAVKLGAGLGSQLQMLILEALSIPLNTALLALLVGPAEYWFKMKRRDV